MARDVVTSLSSQEILYGYLSLVFTAAIIFVIGRFTNLDLIIEDYYYDTQLQMFTWKNSWFAKQLMHVYVKDVIIAIALLFISFVVLDLIRKFKFIDAWTRIRVRFIATAAILIPTIISGLKQMSVLHCPWDEQRYGGDMPYLRLFDAVPGHMEAGQCFPAGHASTGLWLAALCVFWLPHRPRMGLTIFFAGLSVGFVLGWVQQMRGAHFLTHTLWSMWIASFIIILMLSFSQTLLKQRA